MAVSVQFYYKIFIKHCRILQHMILVFREMSVAWAHNAPWMPPDRAPDEHRRVHVQLLFVWEQFARQHRSPHAHVSATSSRHSHPLFLFCSHCHFRIYPYKLSDRFYNTYEYMHVDAMCTDRSMQKKLFIEPIANLFDRVELELVYSQLINEVFEARIPLAIDSAVRSRRCFESYTIRVNELLSTLLLYR